MSLAQQFDPRALWQYKNLPLETRQDKPLLRLVESDKPARPPEAPAEPQERFDQLVHHCIQLLKLCETTVPSIAVPVQKHWEAVAGFFFWQQLDHMDTMLTLAQAKKNAVDLAVAAGTMLKGMAYLRWMSLKPGSRALQWKRYAIVLDYYELERRRKEGEPVPAADREWNRKRLRECEKFLTLEARRALRRGKPLPEQAYELNWHAPHTLKEIFLEGGFETLYGTVYLACSNVTSWNAGGVASLIGAGKRNPNVRGYKNWDTQLASMALSAAYQALFVTTDVANDALILGIQDKLVSVGNEYISQMSKYRDVDAREVADTAPIRPTYEQALKALSIWDEEDEQEQKASWEALTQELGDELPPAEGTSPKP